MATTLLSPGVSVTVTDESQYLPAAQNSIPFVLIATAQDKIQGTSAAVAPGTLKANANKLYLITSQRDLATVYGNPYFYKTTSGTPINGYELNEYGLQAAYSALGVSNRCYVQRVDIDLSELVGSSARPDGTPPNGAYWLDVNSTRWGLFEYDPSQAATSSYGFTVITPIVITDLTDLQNGTAGSAPLDTIGTPGQYAVVVADSGNEVYYKVNQPALTAVHNTWQQVGTAAWQSSIPAVTTSSQTGVLNVAGTLYVNGESFTITTSTSLNSLQTALSTAITDATFAVTPNDTLSFYGSSATQDVGASGQFSVAGDSNVLTTLNIGQQSATAAGYVATSNNYSVTFNYASAPSFATMPAGTLVNVTGNSTYAITNGVIVTGVNSASSSITISGFTSIPGNATVDFSATVANVNATVDSATTSKSTNATTSVQFRFGTALTSALPVGDYFSITSVTGVANASVPSTAQNAYLESTAATTGSITFTYPASVDFQANSQVQQVTSATINQAQIYGVAQSQQSPHTQVPAWGPQQAVPAPALSIWNKTTAVNNGEFLSVKKYNDGTGTWVLQDCPLYASDADAIDALDPSGGGRNIAAGATYAQYNYKNNGTMSAEIFERYVQGTTVVSVTPTGDAFTIGDQFTISVTSKGTNELDTRTAEMMGSNVAAFITAVQDTGLTQINISITPTGDIQLVHNQGGTIILVDTTNISTGEDSTAVSTAGFEVGAADQIRPNYDSTGEPSGVILSNWVGNPAFEYTASDTAPFQNPDDGRLWYYSSVDQVDIMVHNGTEWVGYQNGGVDIRGFNLDMTNPTGPLVSPTMPTEQSDGTPLALGDLWVNTSDLEVYPNLYRWEEPAPNQEQWVKISLSDQTTQNGILFADARWATNGTTDPVNDPIPTIQSLLTSNYLDLDAPDSALYPNGMLLWNTRRSGYNVKRYAAEYFTVANFPEATTFPAEPYTWVTASGNQVDGSMYAGRKAQRSMVVQAMRAGIDTGMEIREDANPFNLLACPNYPELIPNMVVLNNDRNNTAFIIGDTPLRLDVDPQTLQAYATNVLSGQSLPEDNVTTGDPYVAVYYPSCETTDNTGSTIVMPSSHMMIRTYIRSDNVSYPWFAPAGTRRGVVDNAFAIGYLDAQTGEFQTTQVGQNVRDILYPNNINPITFIPGVGITAYGQKTRFGNSSIASALDRVNVARLVVYLRQRLQQAVQAFLFEPNDRQTRAEVTSVVTTLLQDIAAKRGLYDYLVVCDDTNNTPARIDRNELYIDIAIEPAKAVEFIYIPIRIKNTGEIATQATA